MPDIQYPLITYIPMTDKLPDKIDLTRCMAFKSKSDKIQCPCRHRPGSRFCGKHAATKQEILANGSRRSARQTLQQPSRKTFRKTLMPIPNLNTQLRIPNTNQTTILPTNNKPITQIALHKDPYLSKLTSQQIFNNFIFYQLNKYISMNRQTHTQINTRTQDQSNINSNNPSTETKRKLLIKLLSLLSRIDYLDPLHSKIIKLQRYIRKYRYKIRRWNRGAGSIYPLIQCTNKDDFCSLDPLDTIPQRLLFTYRDTDGFTYGFNLLSFLDLLAGSEQPLNPYTRKPITRDVINRANRYYRILDNWSKVDEPDVLAVQHGTPAIHGTPVRPIQQSQPVRLSLKDRTKQRLQAVFQKINYLGYQTNTNWLLDKPAPILITFIKTIARNWSYQLGFSDTTKQALLSPANLIIFESLVNDSYHNQQLGHISTLHIMNRILAVLEPLISNPADPNSAALLVLYSLYYIEPRRVSLANPWMA